MLGYGAIYYHSSLPIDCFKYKFVGGMDDFFSNLYRVLTDYPVPHVVHNEVKDVLMVYLALLKPYATGLIGEIDTLEHVALPKETKMRVNQKFPILYPPSKSTEIEVVKTKRYQELINENKRFVLRLCEEYCINNKQISVDIERLIPLAFSPDLSSREYEYISTG
jgi:hypothetical protein